MWIRNQEVTLGEAEGRERSREIGRQRETGGLGGEKERHRVGREEWVGEVGLDLKKTRRNFPGDGNVS